MSTLVFLLPFLLIYYVLAIYAERKISAFMQDRLGPMEVGYYGILQTIADVIKLIQKEDLIPTKADKGLFKIAPVVIFLAVITGFSVIPLNSEWSGSAISSGVFFLLAIISLDVIGILMAGWSSNNKYSVLGTMRSAAQIIAYEIPLGLSILCVVMVSQTLNLQEISIQQSLSSPGAGYLFGIQNIPTNHLGGFLMWNVIQMPLLFFVWIIFFIASLAECNRAPFDLPEAESELVAGFQTEYSGFRWGIIMLAEYGMMLLVSFLGAILFFGSWNTPFLNLGELRLADWTSGNIWGIFWLVSKTLFFVAMQIWVRWTFPRLRIDQLMSLSWKYLTPAALLLIILCGTWKVLLS